MSGIGTGYDLSVGTFSPDGRIFQTDYAQKSVDNSGTVLGIRCKDGVVLGVEKTVISKMLEEGSNRWTYPVDRHAGVAIAGLPADGRQVVNRALAEARNYKSTYGEPIPGKVLCERVASYVHVFNLYWYVRPFGTAMLMAVYDKDGPQLYLIEPSGTAHVRPRSRGLLFREAPGCSPTTLISSGGKSETHVPKVSSFQPLFLKENPASFVPKFVGPSLSSSGKVRTLTCQKPLGSSLCFCTSTSFPDMHATIAPCLRSCL